MRTVFVFGNPLVGDDSLALKVAERIGKSVEGIEFVPVQSLDEVEGKDLLLLDVARGIDCVQLIEGLDALQVSQPVSGHDFGLALELKLLEKLGRLGRVRIIAIPVGFGLEEATRSVKRVLRPFSSLP